MDPASAANEHAALRDLGDVSRPRLRVDVLNRQHVDLPRELLEMVPAPPAPPGDSPPLALRPPPPPPPPPPLPSPPAGWGQRRFQGRAATPADEPVEWLPRSRTSPDTSDAEMDNDPVLPRSRTSPDTSDAEVDYDPVLPRSRTTPDTSDVDNDETPWLETTTAGDSPDSSDIDDPVPTPRRPPLLRTLAEQSRVAAAAGNVAAMLETANGYALGKHGFPRNKPQAVDWWRKGAEMGNAECMRHLGECYYQGQGVARDYSTALEWFKKAADLGDMFALAGLSFMHQHGYGTPPSPGKALIYCKLADAAGASRINIVSPFATVHARAAESFRPAEVARRLEASIAWDPEQVSQLVQEVVDIQLRNADLQAERLAKEARIAATVKAKQSAASSAQTDILANRRNGKAYPPAHAAIVAAWTPTAVDLTVCPACVRRITVGASVLLSECLHGVCASCAPHMVKSDGTIKCPVCETTSLVSVAALQRHPLIEVELGAGTAHACDACKVAPIDEDGSQAATFTCTSCEPARLLCEGHMVAHRTKKPNHDLAPLPDGGAALQCPTHDQPVAAYCSSCRALICLTCLTSTHQPSAHATHLFTDRTIVETARARLLEGAGVARTVADALIDRATDATVAGTEVDARDAAITNEVDRTFNALVGLLERRREAAHAQHAAYGREERAMLQQAREESAYQWRIVTSAADLAEKLARSASLGVNAAAVLAQLEAAAMARLNEVLQMAPSTRVPTAAVLRLDVDEDIDGQLETLGQIVVDAPFRAT